MFRFVFSFSIIGAFAFWATNAAMAAPQVLAVLSTGNGAAMECNGGVCMASLSAYCLQRDRESPSAGTAYYAADTSRFSLVLDFADGSEKTLPVGNAVTFSSKRGFKAVDASISRSILDASGADGVRLVVWEEATLIPVADPDDLDPLTQREIAMATGSLRKLGARVLDSRGDADIARILATMLRGVPEWTGRPEIDYRELRQRVSSVATAEKIGSDGLERIAQEFGNCISKFQARKTYGVGYCLMQRHDEMILDMNKRYWEAQASS